MVRSLVDIGLRSPIDLFSTYNPANGPIWPRVAGRRGDQPRPGSEARHIWRGWGINAAIEDPMYRQMLSYRHRPDNLLHGLGRAGGRADECAVDVDGVSSLSSVSSHIRTPIPQSLLRARPIRYFHLRDDKRAMWTWIVRA